MKLELSPKELDGMLHALSVATAAGGLNTLLKIQPFVSALKKQAPSYRRVKTIAASCEERLKILEG